MTYINYRIVIKVIGLLIFIMGIFLMIPSLTAAFYEDIVLLPFVKSSALCLTAGVILYMIKVPVKDIRKREGYLIVALGWIILCLLGSMPYLFEEGLDVSLTDAIFESTSGLTTTGATIFDDIESINPAILLWRSMTQWIGGMGIIVFTIAIFPILGIGGVELFVAEAPGPTASKIHPQIKEVAKRLWYIYLGLTASLIFILHYLSGLPAFDAINHALTTMSTGGFSTKNDSIAHYNSAWVEYPIMLFMVLAGTNYTILYFLFKGKFQKLWSSDELKFYLLVLFMCILTGSMVLFGLDYYGLEESFRKAGFQVISLLTTTGYVTADYTSWTPGLELMFFFLLFTGACAGSTSGGIKMIRHLVFFKTSLIELKRILHPRGFMRLKIDGEVPQSRITMHILVFLLFYLIIFAIGVLLISFSLPEIADPFKTAVGAVATSLGNVGPSIGSLGPVDNFADLNQMTKVILSLLMVIGRLELFTVIIIFTPYFWRVK